MPFIITLKPMFAIMKEGIDLIAEELSVFEYQEILMGRKRDFTSTFRGTLRDSYIEAGYIWHYAITQILNWNAAQALQYLTSEIVKRLELDKVFPYIDFDSRGYVCKYRIILQYAFPGEIIYDEQEQAIDEWEHVCHRGQYINDDGYHYPKKFFLDHDGLERAKILLRHVVGLYMSDESLLSQYEFFASSKARQWLKDMHLQYPLTLTYDSPLEYFHASLPDSQKNDFMYYNCLIKNKILSQHPSWCTDT